MHGKRVFMGINFQAHAEMCINIATDSSVLHHGPTMVAQGNPDRA